MSRYVPLVVIIAVISVIILVPLKVVGYGYLPGDDALRHAAKAVSGKGWSDILVLRPEVRMDNHAGWHAILGLIYKFTGCSTDILVVFSIVALFLVFCLIPMFFLRWPEAWLYALSVILLGEPSFISRLLIGRPFIFTMSFLLALYFLWPKLKNKNIPFGTLAILTALIAGATWIHGSWYLFIIPILSFLLAREFRSCILLTAAVIAGVFLGAVMTGHPYLFLKQNIMHMYFALGGRTLARILVTEFQPFSGDVLIVFTVVMLMVWRHLRGSWDRKVIDSPIFISAVIGWVLGFLVRRFWLDWGIPATLVWITYEFQNSFKKYINPSSLSRLFLAFFAISVFYLITTSDVNSRWTYGLTKEYLNFEDKEQAPWLPEPGGIIYSDDMGIFYDTFFKNPKAPWRYMLGFEPTIMPPEDLAVLRNIWWNYGAYKSFEPWVKKMRPQDRLILMRTSGEEPKIKGLEWHYAATNIWIGRLPRDKR